MEFTINYNGQAVAVEVTLEVYEFLDRADHKAENLSHEQRRHWDGREFDEYIVATEGVGIYGETPEDYLCRGPAPPVPALCPGRADLCGDWDGVRLLQSIRL